MAKYDIFISYRRDGGEFLGKSLYDKLTDAGYRVFFDVESLRSGKFNTQLYQVIAECQDFILLLPKGALDRCITDPGDWVLQEILCAMQHHKNIIPIMMRGFEWPKNLPPVLGALPMYEGLQAQSEYFDAMVQRMAGQLLHSQPVSGGKSSFGKTRFPVTCGSLFTPAVDRMLLFIDHNELHEKGATFLGFVDGGKTFQDACQSTIDLYKEPLMKFYHRDQSAQLRELAGILNAFSDSEKREVFAFARQLQMLWKVFGYDGEEWGVKMHPSFEYAGALWEMCDVFSVLGKRYGMGMKRVDCQFPETAFFQIQDDDSLIPLAPGSAETMLCIHYYGLECKLFETLPRFLYGEEDQDVLTKIREQDVTRKLVIRNDQIRKLWHYSEVSGVVQEKKLFGVKEYYLGFGLEKTEEYLEWNRRPADYKGSNSLYTLDIVRGRPLHSPDFDYEFLILCCEKDPAGKSYCINSPKIYIVNRGSRHDKRFNLHLTVHECASAKEIYSSIAERFALRMAICKAMYCA